MDIRPFDHTLHDAQGIIEVDDETFGDCPYTPEYIVALQTDPGQRVWVAAAGEQIVGFVSAFDTHSLSGDCWEVDELAVRPAFQGQGLGTHLVARAVLGAREMPGLTEIRAVIAAHNAASQRAFAKNGFVVSARADLLLYQVSGRVPRPQADGSPLVRPANAQDAPTIGELVGRPTATVADLIQRPETVYLLAERGTTVLGCAELIHVRTLQYQGFWIESMWLQTADRPTAKALVSAAIEQTKRHPDMDRVGFLVPWDDGLLHSACTSEGFVKIDAYSAFVRTAPGP